MAEPRFLLVSGGSPARVAPGAWPGHWAPVAGSAHADGAWFAWRLLGSNNRELGRSSSVFADASSCYRSALALQLGLSTAEPIAEVNQGTGLWVWRVELDGAPSAVAARPYKRRRECLYSLERFLASAPVATTDPRRPSRPIRGRARPAAVRPRVGHHDRVASGIPSASGGPA